MIIDVSSRMPTSHFHDERGIPDGPLQYKEVASFIERNFGKDVTEATVKTALMRYRKLTRSDFKKPGSGIMP